jgi:hypothetical protein
MGKWLSPRKPVNGSEARAGLALPPANDASMITEVWVPAGVRIQIGVAAARFGHPGGWQQVELLQAIPISCFGHDESLPEQ